MLLRMIRFLLPSLVGILVFLTPIPTEGGANIGRYLDAEGQHIDRYIEAVDRHTPYKDEE